MMLTNNHLQSIQESVLCWLATSDLKGNPNVSPKEAFCEFGNTELIIANIASPISVRNISVNPSVCVSFIHVFRQKGFKLKGHAKYLKEGDSGHKQRLEALRSLIGEKFPIKGIISVHVDSATPIIAPSYTLFPEETESQKIAASKKVYNVE